MVHQSRGSKFWQRSVANREDHSCSSVTGISSKDGFCWEPYLYNSCRAALPPGREKFYLHGDQGLGQGIAISCAPPKERIKWEFLKGKGLVRYAAVRAAPEDGPLGGGRPARGRAVHRRVPHKAH